MTKLMIKEWRTASQRMWSMYRYRLWYLHPSRRCWSTKWPLAWLVDCCPHPDKSSLPIRSGSLDFPSLPTETEALPPEWAGCLPPPRWETVPSNRELTALHSIRCRFDWLVYEPHLAEVRSPPNRIASTVHQPSHSREEFATQSSASLVQFSYSPIRRWHVTKFTSPSHPLTARGERRKGRTVRHDWFR